MSPVRAFGIPQMLGDIWAWPAMSTGGSNSCLMLTLTRILKPNMHDVVLFLGKPRDRPPAAASQLGIGASGSPAGRLGLTSPHVMPLYEQRGNLRLFLLDGREFRCTHGPSAALPPVEKEGAFRLSLFEIQLPMPTATLSKATLVDLAPLPAGHIHRSDKTKTIDGMRRYADQSVALETQSQIVGPSYRGEGRV